MTVEVCFSCETELPDEASYCPACGVSVEGSVPLLDPLGSLRPDEGDAAVGSAESSVTRAGPGGRRLLVVVGTVAALAVAWAAFGNTGTAGESTPSAGADALTVETSTTVAPEVDESPPETTGSEVDTDDTGDDREDEDEVSAADWPPISIESKPGSGEPVLGEPVGQYLIINRSADVLRLDLDTGAMEIYQTLARPIASFGSELLMWSRQGLVAAPADDAGAEPRIVYSRPVDGTLRSYLEALSVLDGDRLVFEFALFASGDVGPVNVLVDLSSGESSNIAVPPRSSSVGGLVTVPGGGTFDFVEGEFRPVFQGEVVAVGRRSLVGYQCTDPQSCSLVLVDRTTGDVSGATIPDVPLLTDIYFVDPEDRYLLVIFDRPRLWDLRRGEYVADGFLDGLTADGPPRETPAQVAVSPDGRWVGSGAFNTVRFHDIERDVEYAVELPPSSVPLENVSQVLFVEKADGS